MVMVDAWSPAEDSELNVWDQLSLSLSPNRGASRFYSTTLYIKILERTICLVHLITSDWSRTSAELQHKEDFGKRNLPGKRARRHLSRLSEFERCLIIGMKTAGWSTRRVAGQVDRSECAVRNCWEQWTREGTHVRKTGPGATRKTTRRVDRRIVRQALVDPTVTRSTIRADVGVAFVPQTISRHLAEANLKSERLSVHSL
ncbi:uncharacterized protein TNCV_703781 [Trichonephila clavipes]|nr:uncharacterized protein TNCV_703781 [Trichonephila clavipes]